MRFLLDTSILLWLLTQPMRVRADARHTLTQLEHERYVSAVSAWEVAIKTSVGKLSLGTTDIHAWWRGALDDLQARPLLVQPEHALATARLPLLHRDPFDRLLIAQAMEEGLTLATADPLVQRYDVEVLRC